MRHGIWISIFISLYLIVSSQYVYSQQTGSNENFKQEIDGLLDDLQKAKGNVQRVVSLNQLAEVLSDKDPERALAYARQALNISTRNNLDRGTAISLYNYGLINLYENKTPNALNYFYKSIALSDDFNDKLPSAKASLQIARLFHQMNDREEALYYYRKASGYLRSIDRPLYAVSENETGDIFFALDSLGEALRHYENVIQYRRYLEPEVLIHASERAGDIFMKQKKYKQALQRYSTNLDLLSQKGDTAQLSVICMKTGEVLYRLHQPKKAIEYFKKCIALSDTITNLPAKAKSYEYIGSISWYVDSSMMAIDYLITTLELRRDLVNEYPANPEYKQELGQTYNTLGLFMDSLGFHQRAIEYLTKGFDIGKDLHSAHLVKEAALGLNSAYFNLEQDLDAEFYLTVYDQINDSLSDDAFTRTITRLEMQAGFNKETEIRKLVQEKKDTEQQAQLRRQTYVRNFLLAFLTAILIFAFMAYRGLRRIRKDHRLLSYQQREILEKNEELNKQKEEILDQAEQIERTNWELEKKNQQLKQKNEQIKKGQQQLILQEKLATVGQLITGIAHEIQNPLNFVNNFSNLTVDLTTELLEIVDENKSNIRSESMEQLKEVTEMIESNVKKINEHGRRADRIIKGMLQQSREAGEFELTDLNILVTEYASLAYHGEKTRDKSLNINIIQNLDNSIGNVNVVPHDLGRVILNLITNSCYAIREKKAVTKKPYSPEIHISTSLKNDNIRVSVWDNGIGISPAVKSKIFNPFYTTKPAGEGTGLGLSTSYEIINKVHKGKLEVESKKGEFTEFSFTIPKKIV